MRNQFEIYHIKAFTTNPSEGNAAAVMFGDKLTDQQLQFIAKQTNYSETAFLSSSAKADYKLQWFTSLKETDLCGHATIASLHFLSENKIGTNANCITFETRSGILKCFKNNDLYEIQMPFYEVHELNIQKYDILNAYKIPGNIVDDNTPVLTLSNSYVFVKIKSYKDLVSYKPMSDDDNEIIRKFPDISLYTTDTLDSNAAHQRFFSPGYGIIEDPVTGSASAYLALVLLHLGLISEQSLSDSITIEQGDHLCKKGRVKVRFNKSRQELVISGNAVTFLKGNIII